MKRAVLLSLSIVAASGICAADARADDFPTAKERHFYKGYDYGSQSLYNPIWVILNRGFDTLQLRPANRSMFGQNLYANGANVVDNIGHPVRAVDAQGGWWRLIRQEILPLSWTSATARWVPNYTLHLLGGGQTFAMLSEWYDAHDAPLPPLWAGATLYTAAFVNEMIENRDVQGPNTDALADLMVFDVAGIVLFSFEPVRVFFSHTMIVSDWSLQPAIGTTRGTLYNVGNYYSVKVPMPFWPNLRLFAYAGYSTQFGLSYKLGQHSISASYGARFTNLENLGKNVVENTVQSVPAGAIFFDRKDSLLASLQIADVPDYFAHLNVYPNAFFWSDPGIGFFFALSRDADRFATGISLTRSLGFGVGTGNL